MQVSARIGFFRHFQLQLVNAVHVNLPAPREALSLTRKRFELELTIDSEVHSKRRKTIFISLYNGRLTDGGRSPFSLSQGHWLPRSGATRSNPRSRPSRCRPSTATWRRPSTSSARQTASTRRCRPPTCMAARPTSAPGTSCQWAGARNTAPSSSPSSAGTSTLPWARLARGSWTATTNISRKSSLNRRLERRRRGAARRLRVRGQPGHLDDDSEARRRHCLRHPGSREHARWHETVPGGGQDRVPT